MDLKEIQQLLRDGRYEVSLHAQQERLEEDLDLSGLIREPEEAGHEPLRRLQLLRWRGRRADN